jgi:hypothetical protein
MDLYDNRYAVFVARVAFAFPRCPCPALICAQKYKIKAPEVPERIPEPQAPLTKISCDNYFFTVTVTVAAICEPYERCAPSANCSVSTCLPGCNGTSALL